MIFNVLMYTLPAIFIVCAAFMLYYRATLLEMIGLESNKLVFAIAILFFALGILAFVLIITGNLGFLLIWMIISLVIFFAIFYFLYLLYKQNKDQ